MGHLYFRLLPDTKSWHIVTELIAEGAPVEEIADATLRATSRGVQLATEDEQAAHALVLVSEAAKAARQEDFSGSLRKIGIDAGDDPTLYDVVSGFSEAMDRYHAKLKKRTELSELAHMAAVESLTKSLRGENAQLFTLESERLRQSLKSIGTQKGFATFARDFYARFIYRFLTYHLSRELSFHCGGNGRFSGPIEHNRFLAELETHCRNTSESIQQVARKRFSEGRFSRGISTNSARDFSKTAIATLNREMKRRGGRGV